jgi:putative acetyltransferase
VLTAVIVPERPDTFDATQLITELEESLAAHYPQTSRHGFSVEKLLREGVAFFVTRQDGLPAGCGGLKFFDAEYAEIKRMYVRPQFRGLGLGKLMLNHLADCTRQHHLTILRLETGIYQTEAIRLYESFGFRRIPPFGSYFEDPLSLCYEKRLSPE